MLRPAVARSGRRSVLTFTLAALPVPGPTTVLAASDSAPILWYANRASGYVLLVLLTLATAAGVLAGTLRGSTRWPRSATQALHRNLALLSIMFLAVHVCTAVADEFVDIRWWDAFIPFASSYERGW